MKKILNERFAYTSDDIYAIGGMADIYKAYDMDATCEVALKLFRCDFASDEVLIETFNREQQALFDLNIHKNIVNLIDAGVDDDTGRRYIAMEWVDEDLEKHINNNPVKTWDEYYERYGKQILDGLMFAYSRDILHRDITPNNILVNSNGEVKIADFGISKYKKYYPGNVTLVGYKTSPYAPNESGLDYPDVRDVFSYVVTSLECISNDKFEHPNDAKLFLENDLSSTTEISTILYSSLNVDPSLRPFNIIELYERLNDARRVLNKKRESDGKINIVITNSVVESVKKFTLFKTESQAKLFILDDVNQGFLFKQHEDLVNGEYIPNTRSYNVITSEYSYLVKRDTDDDSKLVFIACLRMNDTKLEIYENKSVSFNYSFNIKCSEDKEHSKSSIDSLLLRFSESIDSLEQENLIKHKNSLTDIWRNSLYMRKEIEQISEKAINYTNFEVDGKRIILTVDNHQPLNMELIGEPRIIRNKDKTIAAGEIEWIDGNEVTLFSDAYVNHEIIPKTGTLVFDTNQSMIAINRQRDALDMLMQNKAVKSNMKDLLLDPSIQPKPLSPNLIFVQNDLDDSKKDAVTAAIGTNDFLVVEGPPGTGKTKFIVETIIQCIKNKQSVLLSSQTHIALDNALERLQKLIKEEGVGYELVRIGRRNDPRISKTSTKLLLENGVINWVNTIKDQSEKGVEAWVKNNGVDLDQLKIGVSLSRLRKALISMEEINKEVQDLRIKNDKKNKEISAFQKDQNKEGSLQELKIDLGILSRNLSDKTTIHRSRENELSMAYKPLEENKEFGTDIYKYNIEDIREYEDGYIGESQNAKLGHDVLNILDDWFSRLIRQDEFQSAYLASANVVAGTCVGVAGTKMQKLKFDVCIVDEASKALPTEILVPMVKARKWIVVGDTKQLPPYMGDFINNKDMALKYNLDETKYRNTILSHLENSLPEHSRKKLLMQYRMVKPIGNLVSHCFYNDELKSCKEFTKECIIEAKAVPKPVTWYSTSKDKNRHQVRSKGSYKNIAEINIIKLLLKRIQFSAKLSNDKYDIVIMSGYAAQVEELKRSVAVINAELPDLNIECCTVDTYQGREADIAIYSVTRSNAEGKIGFLQEKERLNVALSRGKEILCIVGDSRFCDSVMGENPFRQVLDYIRSNDECIVDGEIQ